MKTFAKSLAETFVISLKYIYIFTVPTTFSSTLGKGALKMSYVYENCIFSYPFWNLVDDVRFSEQVFPSKVYRVQSFVNPFSECKQRSDEIQPLGCSTGQWCKTCGLINSEMIHQTQNQLRPWPTQSTDLHSVECLWCELKRIENI